MGENDPDASTVGADPLDQALREIAAAPNVRPSAEIAPGRLEEASIVADSFRVERKLGEGGMGVVYLAWDIELERSVALKVQLRGSENAVARMAREARAMARLSHPNVVPVHEVGEHQGRLFIAMEYVPGGTVRDWLKTERTWREIVALFVQAGHGLHAAHSIDLVHRDFKPDNVLVGEDQRPRVADFGLARAAAGRVGTKSALEATGQGWSSEDATRSNQDRTTSSGSSSSSSRAARLSASLKQKLTQTGAAVGTVAYMAPEQWVGTEVDARADQFSFCVALFEALYGTRPFAGRTAGALLNNIQRGRIREPPADRRVPRRILKVLRRGLSANPGDRFATMPALLSKLEQQPLSKRQVLLSLGALTIAGVAGATMTDRLAEAPCEPAVQEMESLWNPDAQAEVRASAENVGKAYVVDGVAIASEELSNYADDWVAEYRSACEATHVRKEQTESLFALRAACLANRRRSFERVVAGLRSADLLKLEQAPRSTHRLPSIEPCANTEALARLAPLPEDPKARAALLELDEDIADLVAQVVDQDYEDSLAEAERLIELATQLGYRPAIGRARMAIISVQDNANRFSDDGPAREAFNDGLASGEFYLAANAAALLAEFYGPRDASEAHRWVSTGTALLDQIGAAPVAYVNLIRSDAIAYAMSGKPEEARPRFERSIELLRAADPEDPKLITAYSDLAVMFSSSGDAEQGAHYFGIAHQLASVSLGPRHPGTARILANVARTRLLQGKHNEALPLFEQAREVLAAAYGDDHPAVARADFELSDLYAAKGEPERALRMLARAVEVMRTTDGHRLPARFEAETVYARMLAEQGAVTEAAEQISKTVAALRELSLPQELAIALTESARQARERGEHREALAQAREAVSLLESVNAFGGSTTAWLEVGLAHHALEAWAEASEAYRSAVSSAEGRKSASSYAATALLRLADVERETDGIDEDTADLVRRAVEMADKVSSSASEETAKEGRAWLEQHGYALERESAEPQAG